MSPGDRRPLHKNFKNVIPKWFAEINLSNCVFYSYPCIHRQGVSLYLCRWSCSWLGWLRCHSCAHSLQLGMCICVKLVCLFFTCAFPITFLPWCDLCVHNICSRNLYSSSTNTLGHLKPFTVDLLQVDPSRLSSERYSAIRQITCFKTFALWSIVL